MVRAMSSLPIKDSTDSVRNVDVFQRSEGPTVVEVQAIAVVDPTTGAPVQVGAGGALKVEQAGAATEATLAAAAASLVTLAARGTPVSRSGTVAAGGTAQQLIPANADRAGFAVQNLSTGDLWINDLGAAAASQPSLLLVAGAYYETPAGYGSVGAVSIFGATTGRAFTAREW